MPSSSARPTRNSSTTKSACVSQLQQLFEERADLHPHQVAVEYAAARMTYQELERSANKLARFLVRLGAGPERCVAFWLPRSIDTYIALLGILKSGSAYVPLDADYPAERVNFILQDSDSLILITTSKFRSALSHFAGIVVCIDDDAQSIEDESFARLIHDPNTYRPESLCYVIYTSGSTGKPKGVQIEHRNALHLAQTEARRFAIRPEDRVFQGFSIAFDASIEELWLAWCAGATLVAATPEVVHAGPDLPAAITSMGITVLSCVPTLLAMMEGDLPTVRILIVGGETCSPDLVTRWCRPGRRMFNTYGPTEATVIATWTECDPSRPVTIGQPLPGYTAFVLNSQFEPCATSESGELFLGGAGLARGYVGREDLTRERFLMLAAVPGGPVQRLYRTGDLARWTAEGQLEFLGRVDGQVKLRGFRVELSEIESELIRCPEVLAAAVTVREDIPGIQQLVAYLVLRAETTCDEDDVRRRLRQTLPVYMIPELLEPVDTLPRLTSGKVDRKQLPAPRPRNEPLSSTAVQGIPRWQPRDEFEQQLSLAFNETFSATVDPNQNFFLDLGGHSLLAARMVSFLRTFPQFADVSMLDVYNHPTVIELAAALRNRKSPTRPPDHAVAAAQRIDADAIPIQSAPLWQHRLWKHRLCGAAQAISLYLIAGFFSLQWLAPYLTYTILLDDEYPLVEATFFSLTALVLIYPVMLTLGIVVKWLVIGRVRPGRYPLWGVYFFRWWFVRSILNIVPTAYLAGTPLLSLYYRMMGARIGANVHLANDGCHAYDLLSIGDDSCLGADSHFTGATIEDGWLVLGSIEIGQNCFVGTRSVLCPQTVLQDGAQLDDLSLLTSGSIIPAGACWRGSPASSTAASALASGSFDRPTFLRRFVYGLLYLLGVVAIPLLPMAAFFPGMAAMVYLNSIDEYYHYLILAPAVATSFVVLISLEIAAVKWLLLGRIQPGSYPLHHGFYYRKWFVDRLLHLSLDVIGPLYSTLYLAPWYRLLGARIGRRSEISTASFVSPDCLDVGDESFVADAASLGSARVQHGQMIIGMTRIGRRTFIGNSALIPPGATIPDNCLIGCLSISPEGAIPADTSWLGSPAIFLPQRQSEHDYSEQQTFQPTRWMIAQRLFIEFFRITLPSTLFIVFTSLLLSGTLLMYGELPLWQIILIFPLFYLLAGAGAVLVMAGCKWTLIGRYRAGHHPLWSRFVWRTEVVTALLDHFVSPFFVDLLTGTPFVCWFFRLLGARIGRRVYLDTTELTEFDLVQIGDDVAVNLDCTLQTHLFEDRVMKMDQIRIDQGSHLGAMSLVLYDTHIHSAATIGDLSLVMKGETIPSGTAWNGIPVRKAHG